MMVNRGRCLEVSSLQKLVYLDRVEPQRWVYVEIAALPTEGEKPTSDGQCQPCIVAQLLLILTVVGKALNVADFAHAYE